MKPFLKWAGGKHRIVERIRARLPQGKRLIEPFVGSGAVFLNTDFEEYVLADINPDLIQVYATLKQHGQDFISYCKELFTDANNTPERYYELRSEFNETQDPWRKSALFVYLNRHGYNGLCRYNSSGGFNVPFGRYKRPYFPEQEMKFFSQKLQVATLQCADFRQVMEEAVVGDVIYCDPPYVPLSATSNFTDYAADGFTTRDQADLARLATQLGERGIPVLISNHATEFTTAAYAAAEVEHFPVRRTISCDGA
ncbi:MAG: Dam family site-specific DNA-(adenine-N6)-methyltransferase, partial [Alicyclobacillus herbarius]|uniref:Dam family site-specific DNA-(adenine-N6)-methyltransferase n=1 Tax=Alicyclobacillus herbarius TaxID=122960 RepID=UPI002357F705